VKIVIRQAMPRDVKVVSDILGEAARWLDQRGMSLWKVGELSPTNIADDVNASLFFLAECNGEAAGTVKFQLEDLVFWPDTPQEESAFIHRLAGVIFDWIARHRARVCERFTNVLDFGITATNKLGHILFPATSMRS
jgi:hypothetical protein